MADEISEKELLLLQRKRRRDREQATTRRRRQGNDAPKRINDVFGAIFPKGSDALEKIEISKAIAAWELLVGPAAAANSTACRVRNRQLVVWVRDPLWMQQLSLLKNHLIRQYQASFPSLRINDIYFTRWQVKDSY